MCCQFGEWPHGICGRRSGEDDDVEYLVAIIKLWFVIFAVLRLDLDTGPRLARVGEHLPNRGGEAGRVVQEAGVTTGKHSGRRPEPLGKCFGRT
jgi:hypothetical protein